MTTVIIKTVKEKLRERRKERKAREELRNRFHFRNREDISSDSIQNLNETTKVYPMSRFMIPFTRNQPLRELNLPKSTFRVPKYKEDCELSEKVKL